MNKKYKKLVEELNDFRFYCPKCGLPVPPEVFQTEDYGMNYHCKVCGCCVFTEYKKK